MTNLSLYQLIKQKSQEKGRPLKIICDWDDCLFSFRANVVYEFTDKKTPFKQFFEDFWEKVISEDIPSSNRKFTYSGTGEFKIAYDKFEQLRKERSNSPNKDADKYKKLHVSVDEQQILSTADDLLKALREDLISELKIVSASFNNMSQASNTVNAKRKRFAETFGKFPQSSFDIQKIERISGKNKPHRWEWIRDNHSDFDIFIDDNDWWIWSVRKHFPNRVFVVNDYRYSKNTISDNIYHVKTTISDLANEDFQKVAEEYKTKKNMTDMHVKREREREREHLKATNSLLRDFYWSSD